MFNFFKKAPPKIAQAIATQSGSVFFVEKSSDAVFAEKILGDGVFIRPEGNAVFSPVSGSISNIASACHAYGIVAEDGAEILVHIGIDTVELEGIGFRPCVEAGQTVKKGDVLCEVNIRAVLEKGMSLDTAIVLTNMDEYEVFDRYEGVAQAKETALFCYRKRS